MPNYKGHLFGGVVAYILLLLFFVSKNVSLFTVIEWLFFSIAGALFPDIDVKSKGQKYFYYGILIFFLFLVVKNKLEILCCCSFLVITPMLVRHRGLFHQLWFIIAFPLFILCLVSYIVPRMFYSLFIDTLFFIAGAISHIWLDVGLVRMLKPKKKWKRR